MKKILSNIGVTFIRIATAIGLVLAAIFYLLCTALRWVAEGTKNLLYKLFNINDYED